MANLQIQDLRAAGLADFIWLKPAVAQFAKGDVTGQLVPPPLLPVPENLAPLLPGQEPGWYPSDPSSIPHDWSPGDSSRPWGVDGAVPGTCQGGTCLPGTCGGSPYAGNAYTTSDTMNTNPNWAWDNEPLDMGYGSSGMGSWFDWLIPHKVTQRAVDFAAETAVRKTVNTTSTGARTGSAPGVSGQFVTAHRAFKNAFERGNQNEMRRQYGMMVALFSQMGADRTNYQAEFDWATRLMKNDPQAMDEQRRSTERLRNAQKNARNANECSRASGNWNDRTRTCESPAEEHTEGLGKFLLIGAGVAALVALGSAYVHGRGMRRG